jgi:hypothetical protein
MFIPKTIKGYKKMRTVAEDLAEWLESHPRDQLDLDAAALIRKLERVYAAAYDMVYARNDVASRAAYAELYDLLKGKKND